MLISEVKPGNVVKYVPRRGPAWAATHTDRVGIVLSIAREEKVSVLFIPDVGPLECGAFNLDLVYERADGWEDGK
jgi:hypothetical protein